MGTDTFTQLQNTLQLFLAKGDEMPHAYLFLTGSNKLEGLKLAREFAEKILSKPFPNVDTVQFDASLSNIEGVREVLQLASLLPVSSSRKIVLMLNMEQANTQMLNALLKTLEEPPKHTIFLLQSSRPLLATISSRCQVINLSSASSLQNEVSPEVNEALQILEATRTKGLAEKLSLVNTLAVLEDEVLLQLLQHWLAAQTKKLKDHPETFAAVRSSMETLQALQGNFNKKMVLQNFVTTALV